MAITRNAIGTIANAATTSLSVAWPANNVNDIALLFWQTTNSAPATPTGWTVLYNTTTSNTSRIAVYYQFITTVQSGSVSLTDTVTGHQAFIATYSGVDNTVAPTLSAKNGSKSSSWTTNSVTWSGSYAIASYAVGSSTSYTLSAIASSSGTFTPTVEVNATAGTYQMTLIDGPLSSAVTASINATCSPNSAYGSYAIVLAASTSTGIAPVASFTATPTSGTAPLTTAFTDTSTNTPTSWSWTFGDGGTSTVQNPSYTYASPGTYSVSLTAANASGSNTSTSTNYISAQMALPYTETWTGADGSAWPSVWSGNQTFGSGGGATIATNAGQIQSGTGSAYGYRELLTAMPSIADTNIITNFVYPSQVDGYVRFGLNSDGTASANTGWKWASQNGYYLQFATSTTDTSSTYQVMKQIADVQTVMVAVTTTTITAGVTYSVRFQRMGTIIRFKLWQAAQAEPPTWTASATDAGTTPAAGIIILSIGSASTAANRIGSFDNLTVNAPGQIKVYSSTTMVAKPVKVWTGSAWVVKPVKIWDGTQWTKTSY